MERPWPHAVTSVINRYYDPTTDQFMSIDPEVATTDQPYVFTNDDPLNAGDPLGLGGGGTCDNTNAAKQRACVADNKAEEQKLEKACPSGYYNSAGKCDPALAKQQTCSYSSCAPSWPSDVIDGIDGAIVCSSGFGTGACVAGLLTITATNVGSDVENGCSPGKIATDAGIGIAGAGLGTVTELGAAALEGASAWIHGIYDVTTGAPSAGATALQSRSHSNC
jgi:hypothetical protein